MKNNQNGFIGIALLVIVAIAVGVGGTFYFVNKNKTPQTDLTTSTSTEEYIPTPVPTTPTQPQTNLKTYSSAQLGLEFSYSDKLFAHERTHTGDFGKINTIDITPDKELKIQGMDGNVSNYDVLVTVEDLPSDQKSFTIKQHLARIQKENTYMYMEDAWKDYVLKEFAKVGLGFDTRMVTINGVEFIESPFFSELENYTTAIYYTFKDGKGYSFRPRSHKNRQSVEYLNQALNSLKFK